MKKFFTTLSAIAATVFMSSQVLAEASVTAVLDENFDAFTEGSVEAPATTDISSYMSGRLSSVLSGWSGSKVYEAGGALLIADGGNLQTSYCNLSTDGGNVRVTLDVLFPGGIGGIKLSMGYLSSSTLYVEGEGWQTVQFFLSGGSSYSKLKFEPSLAFDGVIIDNLKVETSPAFIQAPVATQPSVATTTSFTATWERVSGCDGYMLDVYSKDADGQPLYVLQDYSLTSSYTTSYQVTDLSADATYYYTVRSVKGEYTSEPSNEIEVVPVYASIEAPVALAATDICADSFTAHWEACELADGYHLTVKQVETLTEEQQVVLLSEDFSGVVKGSITSVEYPPLQEYLDAYTETPGWYAYYHALAAGYMGISPYGGDGYVQTPVLDLSKAETFTINVNMGVNRYGTMVSDVCSIVVLDADGTVLSQTEVMMDAEFKDYTLELTGAAEAIVRVLYQGSNKLFIDELTISQTLPAGSEVTSLYSEIDAADATSCLVTCPLDNGQTYLYTVQSYVRTVVDGEIGLLYSAPSNAVTVQQSTSAIEALEQGQSAPAFDLMGRRAHQQAGALYLQQGRKIYIAR